MSLAAFRKLIGVKPVEGVGRVASVGASITVSGAFGTIKVSSHIPVSVGDSVLVVGGSIQSVVADQSSLPHYYL